MFTVYLVDRKTEELMYISVHKREKDALKAAKRAQAAKSPKKFGYKVEEK